MIVALSDCFAAFSGSETKLAVAPSIPESRDG